MNRLIAALVLCAALVGCGNSRESGPYIGGAAGANTAPQQQERLSPSDYGVHGGGGGY